MKINRPSTLAIGSDTHYGIKPIFVSNLNDADSTTSYVNNIIGRFQLLKALSHRHVCQYVEIISSKHGRVFVVDEHYLNSLQSLLELQTDSKPIAENRVRKYAFQIATALQYLTSHNITCKNLNLANILLDQNDNVKLSSVGLYHLSAGSSLFTFPFQDMNYIAPEVFASPKDISSPSTNKSDLWSLGIVLVMLLTGKFPWQSSASNPVSETDDIGRTILHYFGLTLNENPNSHGQIIGDNVLDYAENKLKFLFDSGEFRLISREMKEVIASLLVPVSSRRVSIEDFLRNPYFREERREYNSHYIWMPRPYLKSQVLLEQKRRKEEGASNSEQLRPYEALTIQELFQLWLNRGGKIEEMLPSDYSIPPAILRIPTIVRLNKNKGPDDEVVQLDYVIDEKEMFSFQSEKFEDIIIPVKLIELKDFTAPKREERRERESPTSSDSSEPTRNRERALSKAEVNYRYQEQRILTFKKLLTGYPETRDQILKEARKDIPPVLRADTWAAILGVLDQDQHIEYLYKSIDLDNVHASDHQIALDVPRCHQYHHLLSSPEGHLKLSNCLRSWVRYNPQLVYWQGVDSLIAPFLVLNFNNEAKALFCMQEVVKLYVQQFFEIGNVKYLQEHLMMYQHLLFYKDPELAKHLHTIGFNPDLYAIPWFLTMFSHIFSLDKVFRIWDTVLVNPPSLPIFIAVAIMKVLRSTLLKMDFNEAILFFSGMAPIDIEKCLQIALNDLQYTPPSLTKIRFENKDSTGGITSMYWWEEKLSIEALKKEVSPRISVLDLVNDKDNCAVFDVRSEEEFQLMHFPGAINVLDIKDIEPLKKYRGKPVVVMGKGMEGGLEVKLSKKLVSRHFPYVAVLLGGIDGLMVYAEALLEGGPGGESNEEMPI